MYRPGVRSAARGRVHVLQREVQERGGPAEQRVRVPSGPRGILGLHVHPASRQRGHKELDRSGGLLQPSRSLTRLHRHRSIFFARRQERLRYLCFILRQGMDVILKDKEINFKILSFS